jgi:dihydrofolate synthase/folylpolyglutamate synthase
MLDLLCPLVRRVVVTPLSVPRGETPENLHALALARHADTARAGSVEEALRLAAAGLPPDGLVVVSGSLYLVGEVKKALG